MADNIKHSCASVGKWYASFPGAEALLVVWGAGILWLSAEILVCFKKQQYDGVWSCLVFLLVGIAAAYITIRNAISYIKVYADHLVCVVPFKRKIIINYDGCTVGLDYCFDINRNKLWWIYISEGPMPSYPGKNPRNRINAIPCQKGFVRIRYQDEVFLALMDVLPKKQRTALISAKRFMS